MNYENPDSRRRHLSRAARPAPVQTAVRDTQRVGLPPEAGLQEIAQALGVTHQAASATLARALVKARRVLERRGIDARAFFDAMERRRHGDGL